jgi:hypothetical protein
VKRSGETVGEPARSGDLHSADGPTACHPLLFIQVCPGPDGAGVLG